MVTPRGPVSVGSQSGDNIDGNDYGEYGGSSDS